MLGMIEEDANPVGAIEDVTLSYDLLLTPTIRGTLLLNVADVVVDVEVVFPAWHLGEDHFHRRSSSDA
jgi:hypothetical protein